MVVIYVTFRPTRELKKVVSWEVTVSGCWDLTGWSMGGAY